MKKSITLVLALALALVNIGTTSAASVKGKKLSFTANWNANIPIPAEETRVYNFKSQWESASCSKSSVDLSVYKSFTVDAEATAGNWYNMPLTDGKGNPHYPGFAGDGNRAEHTVIFAEVDGGVEGPLTGLGVQNCATSGTPSQLIIYNAYLTKHNGETEPVDMGGALWGGGTLTYPNRSVINSGTVDFRGQWGSIQLNNEALNIDCGIKLRLYTNKPIPYGSVQYCVKFAADNSDGWPQLTKVTDTYAECVIDKPLSSLALQWTSTAVGSIDIAAITYERLDGQGAEEEEQEATGFTSFKKLSDTKIKSNTIKSFSTDVLSGTRHNTVFEAANTVKFNVAEGEKKESEIVAVKKLDGTKVCLATVKILDNMLIVEAEKELTEGDYEITFAPNTFVIDENVWNEELSFITAVSDGNNADVKTAKKTVKEEIAILKRLKTKFVYGVNVFQYAPGFENELEKAIEDAEFYADLFAEEEHVYEALENLRMFVGTSHPNLPKADSKYAIKHTATGLYLNIDGDKVTLQKEAYPIQFHLTEEALSPGINMWGSWDQVYYTNHYAYIYATPDRKYLGSEKNNNTFSVTNKKNTEWLIQAYRNNQYYITTPGYKDLGAAEKAKAGDAATIMTPGMKGYTSTWFIEDYIEPATEEANAQNGESAAEATAINGISETAVPTAVFNANGARVNGLQKGLNIVKMADGSVRKVVVK